MPDESEIEVARYQFHSWARKGISSRISEPDDLGANASATTERAHVSIPVDLHLADAAVPDRFNNAWPNSLVVDFIFTDQFRIIF